MCGLVSLAIVWLGHTYYPSTSVALLIVCSCRKCYRCCLKMYHWRFDMAFQHDGAPVHFSAQTQQHLSTQFPDRWLGCGSPVSWPARSWDLNPLDFFLCGHLKEIVYRDPHTDMEDLTAKFHAAVATIDAGMLRRVQANIPWRAVACQRMHGGHFDHLLQLLPF
jgi:hypothetical protein